MSAWLELLVVALGVARLTILVIEDVVLDKPRDWLLERIRVDGYLAFGLACPWCVSWWVGVAATLAYVAAPGVTVWVMLPFAFSLVAAHVALASDVQPPPPPPPVG